MTMTSQFSTWRHRPCFEVVWFLLLILATVPRFTSISSLVLELWQFSFVRNWPEIRKSEIPRKYPEFCQISGSSEVSKLGIPNLARTCLIKCYLMLQNARVTAFIISELLRETQHGGGWGGGLKWSPTHIKLKETVQPIVVIEE